MTTPSWPGTLPQAPLVDGWQMELSDNRYTFQPRQGRAMLRQKQTQDIDIQDVRFYLTAAQLTTFLTFFRTTLGHGTLSFTFTDVVSGVSYDYQFSGTNPQITSPDGGNHYVVAAQLIRVS